MTWHKNHEILGLTPSHEILGLTPSLTPSHLLSFVLKIGCRPRPKAIKNSPHKAS